MQHATLHLGPTRVAAYTYLTPLLVVLIQWVGGDGVPSLLTLTGVAIILVATVVVQRGSQESVRT